MVITETASDALSRRRRWKIPFIAVFLCGYFALEMMPTARAANGEAILGAVQNSFDTAITPLQTAAATYSLELFTSLFVLEVLLTVWEAYRLNTMNEWLDRITTMVVTYGLGLWLCQHQVEYVQAAIAQLDIIANAFFIPFGPGLNQTPDQIASIGNNMSQFIADASTSNPLINIAIAIPQTLAGVFVQFAYIIIALELCAMRVGFQFVLSVGSIVFGLSAFRNTRQYSGLYIKMLVSALIISASIEAVAGVGILVSSHLTTMINALNASGDLGGLRNDLETIAVTGAAIFAFALLIPTLTAFMCGSAAASVSRMAIGAMQSASAAMMGYAAGAAKAQQGGGSGQSSGEGGKGSDLVAATRTA